jgi:hypothetical protein
MNQPCIYVGKVGETVKYGWARHSRRGTVGPTISIIWLNFLPYPALGLTASSVGGP